jgi:tudor domain-containing protein 1/4/6/7
VGWDGLLHLTPRHEAADVLKMIGMVLDAKYRRSIPRPTDLYWTPGEPCCARFSLDNHWYRAVVLEVEVKGDGALARVRFVDYGTEEWCEVEELRKGLFMAEQPVQAVTVRLDNVEPVEAAWSEAALDFLHTAVVDQVLVLVTP